MRSVIRNNRGDASDIVFLGVIMFFLAVSFIVVIFVNDKLAEVVSTTALNESQASASISSAFSNINTVTVQRGFVLMFSLLIIGMMISAFLIRVHPIFFFIYIITLALSIFISVFMANTYQAIIENPTIASSIAGQQGMINYIMQHSIAMLIGAWAISMLILFGKIFLGTGGLGSSGADI